MTNRKVADIVKDKNFLVLPEHETAAAMDDQQFLNRRTL
jgi:hypothetical protein